MPPRFFSRLRRDRRGSITILAAASMTAMIAVGALAVDIGSVASESRRLQGIADAAAMAAAGNLAAASISAQAAITASGWSRAMTQNVTTGTYTADPTVAVAARFVAGGTAPNAALVTVAENSPLFFGRALGFSSIRLKRTATAARIDLAAFSLGSRLVSLDGGIANQLLGGLTGSSVTLSVADYNALLGADVDLLSYVDALHTELGLTGGSFEQTLATTTTLPHALNALAAALGGTGNSAAASAVAKFAAAAPATAVTLSRLAALGPLGKQDHAVGNTPIPVNAFGTIETILQLAGGARQVQLDLSALAPGLTSVTATLAIGDRAASSPWLALTDSGSPIVRTAQTRLYIDAAIPGSIALKALGLGSFHLPLYVELAEAQARLTSLSCHGSDRHAALEVQPSIGHAALADVATSGLANMAVTPSEQPATFANILGVKVSGSARVDASANGWQTLSFTAGEIASHATKTVGSTGAVNAMASSLVSTINPIVAIGGIVLPLSPIVALVKPVLILAASLLDPVVQTLLDTLGIHLGQADVRIDGVRCGVAALVA